MRWDGIHVNKAVRAWPYPCTDMCARCGQPLRLHGQLMAAIVCPGDDIVAVEGGYAIVRGTRNDTQERQEQESDLGQHQD